MLKTLTLAVVAVAATFAISTVAEARGGRGCGCVATAAPVAVAAAPAATTAAAPSTGYRSFSYQPGTAPAVSSYQSGVRYSSSPRGQFNGNWYRDAGAKIRGE